MSEQNWEVLLEEAIAAGSMRQVATRLGYSSTTLSLVRSGKYLGKTDRIAARVLEVYAVVQCPYQGERITLEICKETALGKAPTHNPTKMAQWRACQKCARRPQGEQACVKVS